MQAELPGWDFEATAAAADRAWNAELSEGAASRLRTNAARRIFYTALYHTMVAPSEFCDVNGDYRGSDGKVHRAHPGRDTYTTFSLWDTYRAAMPLMTDPAPGADARHRPDDAAHRADEQGQLPVWHLMG